MIEGCTQVLDRRRLIPEYESNAWETASLGAGSEKSHATSQTSNPRARSARQIPYGHPSNRSASMYSGNDMPPGSDYWRDSSPLGPNHSSRNLRNMPSNPTLRSAGSNPNLRLGQAQRVQSMAGMSMWGPGSEYGDPNMAMQMQMGGMGMQPPAPFMHPMMTGMSSPSLPYNNPFASPSAPPSDYGLRPPTMFGPYAGAAPRNSVMTNLGGMGMPQGPQARMSSYSVATSGNPFASNTNLAGAGGAAGGALSVNENSEVGDEEVLAVLRRYLAQQDLMSV
jgi:chitin synthase